MEEHIKKLTGLLNQWVTAVLGLAGAQDVEIDNDESGLERIAKDLATLTAVAVIKDIIHARSRKSQALVVESRLQSQAEIVNGYPRAMYHLCTAE